VEFMNDGFHNDDIFRMVEDEFVATAKLYSQHVHYAEYVRLKKLAASRGKDTLAKLKRGTDGTTDKSTSLKLREEAEDNFEQRAQKQQESESDDEYLMDPQLAGLMTGGKRFREDMNQDLTARIPATKSHTRAAAGYSQSPHKEQKTFDVFASRPGKNLSRTMSRSSLAMVDDDETDEDDLNAAPPPIKNAGDTSTKRKPASTTTLSFDLPTPQSKPVRNPRVYDRSRVTDNMPPKPRMSANLSFLASIKSDELATVKGVSAPSNSFKPSTSSIVVDDETKKQKAIEYLAQKRAARERREREEKRKTAKAVTIPTFML
jgi:hypothetical protein